MVVDGWSAAVLLVVAYLTCCVSSRHRSLFGDEKSWNRERCEHLNSLINQFGNVQADSAHTVEAFALL